VKEEKEEQEETSACVLEGDAGFFFLGWVVSLFRRIKRNETK
jgi:hypothetical protein